MEEKNTMEQERNEFSPIQLDVSPAYLVRYVNERKELDEKAKGRILGEAAFTKKVTRFMDVEQAGHDTVTEPWKVKDRMAEKLLRTWSGLVAGLVCPPRTTWLDVEPDTDEEPEPWEEELSARVYQELWQKLQGKGNTFESDLIGLVRDSGELPGGLAVLVSYEDKIEKSGRVVSKPCFDCYRIDNFWLDARKTDWRESYLMVKHTYDREALRRQAGIDGGDGSIPVFDKQAVESVLGANSHIEESGGRLKAVLDSIMPDSDEDGVYHAIEYRGSLPLPDGGTIDDVIITIIGDQLLRAIENPDGYRNWVIMGSRPGDESIYPSSIGHELACIETTINHLLTWADFAIATESAGMLTFNTDRGKDLIKFGRHTKIRPGGRIPDILTQFQYQARLDNVRWRVEDERKKARELIGISDAALAGLPTPGTTATASQGAQQGSLSRNMHDAVHYSGPVTDLVNIMAMGIQEKVKEQMMTEMDEVPEGFEYAKVRCRINSLGVSSIAPFQRQEILQAAELAFSFGQRGVAINPVAIARTALEQGTALTDAIVADWLTPPPPVEPPVDQFPMNPDGTPMLQAVGQ